MKQGPLTECPRCGDVFVFCDCLEDLLDRLGDLRRQGLDARPFDPLELQPSL